MSPVVLGLTALVFALVGWIASEKYFTHMAVLQAKLQLEQHNALLNRHEFEDLFVNSPHPELFDKDGNLDRGDYLVINFPENFDPETEGWFIEDPEEDSDVW